MHVEFGCTEDDMQWGGLSCTETDPCALYLELSSVESVGNKIFTAGNIHTSTVTLYSILLASEDAGKTWREPYQRMRGTALDRIQFVDFENGWISGQQLQPLPQDPFFLITNDGGKTWRQRPIFPDSRMGAILQFWFSSRNNGNVLLDREQSSDSGRYELYESPNGGDTWMIREVSERPIRMRHSGGGNPDWRIRADRATHAFSIERRQGERWNSISSFLVRIGSCKPPERIEPAPPAEPPEPPQSPAAPPIRRPTTPPSLKHPPR